jgi:hypothetical protein
LCHRKENRPRDIVGRREKRTLQHWRVTGSWGCAMRRVSSSHACAGDLDTSVRSSYVNRH